MLKQTHFPEYFLKKDLKKDPWEVVSKKIDALVAAMSAEEKFSLLGGTEQPPAEIVANAGYIKGVPRLGVPEIRMFDGPAGVQSIYKTTGLPEPILMSCAWDEDRAYDFGKIAGTENWAISGNHQLGTQLDTIRSPHFMRNKDMKGEDGFLSGRLGVAECKGVQDQGVIAVMKHLAVANVMTGPMATGATNQIVDEQTLHEIYLRQFEEAVLEAEAGSCMNAYNFVNGHYCSDNNYLNNIVLRGMWKFRGSVMSDWGGNHNMSLQHGTDQEMMLPAFNDSYRILRGIQDGSLTWDMVNNACKHVLGSLSIVGLLSLVEHDSDGKPLEEYGRVSPIRMKDIYAEEVADGMLDRHAQMVYEMAKDAIILAKNNQKTLPLSKADGEIALLGLGAVTAVIGSGGERSFGRLERFTSPAEHFAKMGIKATAEVGIDIVGTQIPADVLYQDVACSKNGVIRTYGITDETTKLAPRMMFGPGGMGQEFNGISGQIDEYGELVPNRVGNQSRDIFACSVPGHETGEIYSIDPSINCTCSTVDGEIIKDYKNAANGTAITNGESYTWKSYLKVPEDGKYNLKIEAIGGLATFIICIDGKWQSAGTIAMREGTSWGWDSLVTTPEGMGINTKILELQKDKVYPICVYAVHKDRMKDLQVRAAWITPSMAKNNYEKAIAAASMAKKTVLFACDFDDAKGGFMFAPSNTIQLPELQQQFILDAAEAAHKNGGKITVVVQSPNARAVGKWVDKADAVLVTYLPGQEGAQALSEILLGKVNPSGKLTVSWPMFDEDTPLSDTVEHSNLRNKGVMIDGKPYVYHSEGMFFGYRWYDKFSVKPAFAFGHGLSYTTFTYSNMQTIPTENSYTIELDVENTGNVVGDEIVQVYLGKGEVPVYAQIAEKQLAGFARVKGLQPGEKRRVSITIPEKNLCYWNIALECQIRPNGTKDKWQKVWGKRKVFVAASSAEIRLEGEIDIPQPQPVSPRIR